MGPRRLTRSRILRAVALGAAVAPLGVAWGLASCILADPPPSLPVILPEQPKVLNTFPPPGNFTNWQSGLNFVVQVLPINPNDGVLYAMVEDDGTANSRLLATPHNVPAGDGGAIEVSVPAPAPSDSSCHTYTLYVDAVEDSPPSGSWSTSPGPPGTVTCNPGLCVRVVWNYEPTGSGATCPSFDAGGLPDVHVEASSDTITIDPDAHPGG